MKYNERIREIREDHDLTQQKVADLLFIGQRTYADYESGKTRIPVDSLIVLARYYNVSMDYIAGISNVKKEFPKEQKSTIGRWCFLNGEYVLCGTNYLLESVDIFPERTYT